MGNVISLAEYRSLKQRAQRAQSRYAAFYFDVSSPFTYLAAERVERLLPVVSWRPVLSDALESDPAEEAAWACAERRASDLRLPLIRPENNVPQALGATRAAAFAAEHGRAPAFVLAASRLAYCGGFDLTETDVIAEAAAAAGLPLEDCLRAAHTGRRDGSLRGVGEHVLSLGAHQLPALVVGRGVFCGERRIAEAVAASRASDVRRHA
jgi:2-hydroxychromene-2-carboxylate isomerase